MDNLLFGLPLVALIVTVFVRLFRKAGYTPGQSVWMAIVMCVPVLNLLLWLYFLMTTWPIEHELAGLRARAGVPTPGDAQAVLSAAIRLESSGDAPGAIAKYEEVVRKFADTEAARDAEASIRSLKERIGFDGVTNMQPEMGPLTPHGPHENQPPRSRDMRLIRNSGRATRLLAVALALIAMIVPRLPGIRTRDIVGGVIPVGAFSGGLLDGNALLMSALLVASLGTLTGLRPEGAKQWGLIFGLAPLVWMVVAMVLNGPGDMWPIALVFALAYGALMGGVGFGAGTLAASLWKTGRPSGGGPLN